MTTAMFHNTLLVDPMANWHNFYQDVLDAYSNKGRAFYDHGLIHLICSDAEWAALPGNEPVADANGDLQPVLRPGLPIRPAPLANNAAAPAVALYNREVERYVSLMDCISDLKQIFLSSIGKDLTRLVAEPIHGTRNLTVFLMLNILRPIYGTPTATTISLWLNELSQPMAATDYFSNLLSTHRGIHDNLARAGQPLSEYEMIQKLAQAVSTYPGHTECIKNYKIANPALANQTFANLGAYVVLQAPNLTTGNLGYSAAAVTLEQVAMMISAESKKAYAQGLQDGSASRSHVQIPHRKDGNHNRSMVGTARRYCYLHGYGTHSGPECHEMKLAVNTYPPVKVNAKDHLSGGSRRNL